MSVRELGLGYYIDPDKGRPVGEGSSVEVNLICDPSGVPVTVATTHGTQVLETHQVSAELVESLTRIEKELNETDIRRP